MIPDARRSVFSLVVFVAAASAAHADASAVPEIRPPALSLARAETSPDGGQGAIPASPSSAPDEPSVEITAPTISLEPTKEDAQPQATPEPIAPTPSGKSEPGYGREGTDWLSFGGFYAHNLDTDQDIKIYAEWSRFIADDFEFVVNAGLWYFNQEGDDTAGMSAAFAFRWHMWHAKDYNWSFFGDAGIGLLFSFDNVPADGTGFNFIPGAGVGFTKAINDSIDGESHGPRWIVGLRWHHVSNGRFEGDERNPSRDSVAIYAGVTIPF